MGIRLDLSAIREYKKTKSQKVLGETSLFYWWRQQLPVLVYKDEMLSEQIV